jgi:DNA polymerase-3 subunit epsilon
MEAMSRTPGPRVAGDRSAAAYAVIDFETSSLSPKDGRAVEMAIVLTDTAGMVVHEWDSLFNPEGDVGATHIHQISQDEADSAPRFSDVADEVVDLLQGVALVAHNASFDLPFLRMELERAGIDVPDIESVTWCTYKSSRYYLPLLERRKLSDCCAAAGVSVIGAHTALGDTRATAKLLAYYLSADVDPEPRPDHVELPARARDLAW